MKKIKEKSLFLLDMDGTIYLGNELFRGTKEFLAQVKAMGGKYIFVTNNSSKGVSDYIEKLDKMGIASEKADFITSVDGLVYFLKNKYGEALEEILFYIAGTKSFIKQMRDEGFHVVESLEEAKTLEKAIDVFVLGFDRELNYRKLEEASYILTRPNEKGREVEYFATNPDWVCPTEWGFVPDCGSMVQMLQLSTGRLPYFIGKPETIMADLAMEKFAVNKEDTILLGDRLYTDILCGNNAGIDTIFLLSGEGTLKDLEESPAKPTYIKENIEEVLNEILN